MRLRFYWWLVVLTYWAFVYQCLWATSPVFMDGGGPAPSFFWGSPPLPGLGEYYSRRGYYDFVYSVPYILASLMMTIAACAAAPRLLRVFRPSSLHTFVGPVVGTLILGLLLALASDVGSLLGVWNGPLFLLRGRYSFHDVFVLAKIFLPVSLLGGVVAVVNHRLFRDTPTS